MTKNQQMESLTTSNLTAEDGSDSESVAVEG